MTHLKKITLACALNLAVFAPASNAALVTNINGLLIDGTLYDVTFHSNGGGQTGVSFNGLWDGDDNQMFGSDSSTFDTMPTFFGDEAGANLAAIAIAAALGGVNTTSNNSDRFAVPFMFASITSGTVVRSRIDGNTDSMTDTITEGAIAVGTGPARAPFVSFTPTVVPVPAAVWLFGSGLIGLIGLARRKVRA